MNLKKEKDYLTTIEAAEVLLVTTETIRQWAQKGKLRAQVTPGGHRRFFAEDIERFATSMGIDINARSVGRQPRILVVDDDLSTQKLLIKFLEKEFEDICTETASNGFEAGQQIIRFKPDIVILDIMMPGISGVDVCKQIRSNKDTRDINVIAITGQFIDENITAVLKAGANVCLAKPVDFEELFKALKLGKDMKTRKRKKAV
jgi:excisionase family DNA binding protein